MELAGYYGMMINLFMRETGLKDQEQASEEKYIKMGVCIQDNGKMECIMGKEL